MTAQNFKGIHYSFLELRHPVCLMTVIVIMYGAHASDSIVPLLHFRLISQGHDVNQRHPLGWTPLHVAAMNRSER